MKKILIEFLEQREIFHTHVCILTLSELKVAHTYANAKNVNHLHLIIHNHPRLHSRKLGKLFSLALHMKMLCIEENLLFLIRISHNGRPKIGFSKKKKELNILLSWFLFIFVLLLEVRNSTLFKLKMK